METVLVERHDKMRVNYLMNALTPQLYHSILDARVEAKWLKYTKEKNY
jgi:hypothetical protein